jgi:carbon storage regulator
LLVITRRVGEKFYIGDDIVVTIIESRDGRIRVGIEAPREVSIARAELKPFVRPPITLPTDPAA